MVKKIKNMLKKVHISRITILAVVFFVLSFILIRHLFELQIIQGEDYRNNFSIMTTKERSLKSTRGNIYDRNGNLLAFNELSYSLTLEDCGTYNSNRERALALNGEAYQIIQLLEKHGDSISQDFHIYVDENGNYAYDVEGTSLLRFKADVYGEAYIDKLEPSEKEATAEEMMAFLISEDKFAIVRDSRPYTEQELTKAGLPLELTKEELLKITIIRYQLSLTSYQKYVRVTIATDLSVDSVAALSEHKDVLTGIEIIEDTKRVYTDSIYFASIIGYTGKASAEELAELKAQKDGYTSTSIIGKAGIEQVMETTLQGSDGSETVYVDNLGKALDVDEESRIEPIAGSDVYLTIDRDLQIATYKILEQRLAGILISVIFDGKEFDKSQISDASEIMIPIYDVYNALINNSIIDTDHFMEEDASTTERLLQAIFEEKQRVVFSEIETELVGESPLAYKDLSPEMQEYMSYIVNDLLMENTGILDKGAIDTSDETYLAWTKEETISLKEYLTYAASQNWINIAELEEEDTYLDSTQVYNSLAKYIQNYLSESKSFSKLLYKYLIKEDKISGTQLCQVLYDQGVLSKEDDLYPSFESGTLNSFDLLVEVIRRLQITPAQLALQPCSGSAVVVDPNTGDTLACVTYPGYDNNRLANDMDVDYYYQIYNDLSRPLYNKATQQTTAPGSTFKLVTASAGLSERVINESTIYNCSGVFDLTETPLSCWNTHGHGDLSVINGITGSCNVFFCNVAYELGTDEENNFRDSLALQKLQDYADLFELDEKSGIEISEARPQVSDNYGIQSSIGQGTHLYTTTQLARYTATLANKGTAYNISLIDKTTDASGNLLKDYSSEILSTVDLNKNIWNVLQIGMRNVIRENGSFNDFGVNVSGKTGTAQESKTSPDHALFISYAPSEAPEIAMAVRIANGYSSTNALLTGKDIMKYYFNLADEAEIITGVASSDGVTSVQTD